MSWCGDLYTCTWHGQRCELVRAYVNVRVVCERGSEGERVHVHEAFIHACTVYGVFTYSNVHDVVYMSSCIIMYMWLCRCTMVFCLGRMFACVHKYMYIIIWSYLIIWSKYRSSSVHKCAFDSEYSSKIKLILFGWNWTILIFWITQWLAHLTAVA